MAMETVDFVCPPHLPPRDAWKVNPDTLRRFYAPTDDRGFVMPTATVEVVKSLFEDDYEWPIDPQHQQTQPDIHHFHWLASSYSPDKFQQSTIPGKFRELPSVKGVLPRQFHNVIHDFTLPPQIPNYQDMEEHIQAYNIARWLFNSAEQTTRAQRFFADSHDDVADGILVTMFDRQFRGYRMNMERLIGAAGLETLRLDDPKFIKRKPHEVVRLLNQRVRFREPSYLSFFNNNAA